MTQGIVKNQHYIPESLLEYFTNSDQKLFEALLMKKVVYPTTPGASMCAKFIYEDDNLKLNTVENYFSKIENEVVPLVKNLMELLSKQKDAKVDFLEIKKAVENLLPTFIVFYYRSGALLTEFSSLDPKDKIPLLSKKILNHNYINLLGRVIKYCYKFAIIESNGGFLMSDQFISTAALKIKNYFTSISNRHVGIRETLILIPISANFYAVYWHSDNNFFLKEDQINVLQEGEIELVNQTIINNSYKKCIGAKQKRLEEALTNFHMEFPSQVFIGHQSGDSSGYIRKKEVFFDPVDKQAFDMLSHHIGVQEYMNAERNDACPCKGGKKFKRCHQDIYERIKIPIQNLINQSNIRRDIYKIPNAVIVESPIDEWGPYSR